MSSATPPSTWLPLALLQDRFNTNLAGLAARHPKLAQTLREFQPAQKWFLRPDATAVALGIEEDGVIRQLPQTLPPALASQFMRQLYPQGICNQPLLVTGEDVGWLLNAAYQLPAQIAAAPGHRSPLFFLIRDIERFWVILHIQEWATLLADTRVRLYAGEDAFAQFTASLTQEMMCPWPKFLINMDNALWPAKLPLDSVLDDARSARKEKLRDVELQLRLIYDHRTPASTAQAFSSGKPLKILGITSRYTTFLQYSMRDWLAGFERLGHRTHLLMESADHETPNGLAVAAACAQFQPDLVVIIDHYRGEMGGIPANVPVAMWAQDYMPNIYCTQGAAAQGPRDYVLGFAYEKMRLVHELKYPNDRYLTATIGMNPQRFSPQSADHPELARYACDVSFVTNASVPAEALVKEQIDRINNPDATRLLSAILDQMRAVYDDGKAIVAPPGIRRIIEQAFIDTRTRSSPQLTQQLMDLFYMRVNNALFRHQSLRWLLDMDIDLRLYGRGWENNPTFAKFARGVADHRGELPLIYQASRINLQASPLGSLHQRVMEGLASGGFFLLRRGDGDILGRHYLKLWSICQEKQIVTDDQLRACTDTDLRHTLQTVIDAHQSDPFAEKYTFKQLLQAMHECNYLCSAGSVWGDDYDQVSYGTKEELQAKVSRFLSQPADRQQISQSMLKTVLDRFTYEKTSQRLLEMIAVDQGRLVDRHDAGRRAA